MLADELVRDGRYTFAGTAGNEVALLRSFDRARADLVVIDIALPPRGAAPAMLALQARRPEIAVVVLAHVDAEPRAPDAALAVLQAGAMGYLDRRHGPSDLVAALSAVQRGELAVSDGLAKALLSKLVAVPAHAASLRPVHSPLSDREWEVLDLLESGATTTQIAERLFISIHTVRSHVKRILRRLGVHSRADAVLAARRMRR